MTYARATKVPILQSRTEIEALVTKHGAKKFASGWDPKGALIAFEIGDRFVRFILPLPDDNEQLTRARWRALLLCLKAKFEAIDAKISDFDAEFLSFIILPGGETVGQAISLQLKTAYESGIKPTLMLGSGT